MSLSSLMVHTCDVVRKTVSRGSGGGQVVSETTIATGLRCRAVPLKPSQSISKEDLFVSYKVYFIADPGVGTRDIIKFTGADGQLLKLQVMETYNPHEMDRFWKVYCSTVKDSNA
jgi:hypothetical protein